MSRYREVQFRISQNPKNWLVTGVAGFIGSHLLESLLTLNQKVTGLDNFSKGHQRNLDEVRASVGEESWQNFEFIDGDIRDFDACQKAAAGVDYVLHHAALGSVPASIDDPLETHHVNVTGFVNMLIAARDQKATRFIYAASSATYGDDPRLPKTEGQIGNALSPYAVTKHANELYADVFARCYGLSSIGLRYFNVFGPRQDPDGAYAAVIPRWTSALLRAEPVFINGDGETTRDFCYVANVVQANLLAASLPNFEVRHEVVNIAVGESTTLNQLFETIRGNIVRRQPNVQACPIFRDFRPGDVKHSLADISKARLLLGYEPSHSLSAGLNEMLEWSDRSASVPAGMS